MRRFTDRCDPRPGGTAFATERAEKGRIRMPMDYIMRSRRMIQLAMTVAVLVGFGACRASQQDLTAMNTAETGPYDVLSEHQLEPGVYEMRVRVQNIDKATQIARNVVHQKASQSPRSVRILIFGAGDRADGAPRQTIRWPEELDYRARDSR